MVDKDTLRKFTFRHDWLSRIITSIFTISVVAGAIYVFYMSSGSYLPAWISILMLSIIILIGLSTPRSIITTTENIEIHCVLDLTIVPISQITKVEKVSRKALRFSLPIWGVWGIFGYYGNYYSFKNMKRLKLYATERKNLVEITYGADSKRIIISVREREDFINLISK